MAYAIEASHYHTHLAKTSVDQFLELKGNVLGEDIIYLNTTYLGPQGRRAG